MVMVIPADYWDNLCTVLASLTQWKEVINQWTVSITNVWLHVYVRTHTQCVFCTCLTCI